MRDAEITLASTATDAAAELKSALPDDRRPDHRTDALRAPLSPEEFYMEGSLLVFTAAYHLRRGYCCNSGCRHCPYREPTD